MLGQNIEKFIKKTLILTVAFISLNLIIDMLNHLTKSQFLYTNQLQARNVEYPPGIANCRDRNIKYLYRILETKESYRGTSWKKIFYSGMRLIPNGYTFNKVREDTPLIEPAYWFLCAKIDQYPNGDKYGDLKKKNLPLHYFSEGIIDYFEKWVRRGKPRYEINIEYHFLASIFTAAYAGISKTSTESIAMVEKFKQSADIVKLGMLEDALDTLLNMEMDKNSHDPLDGYNRALVASWSVKYLRKHYANKREDHIYLDSLRSFSSEVGKLDSGLYLYKKKLKPKKSVWDTVSSNNNL